MICPNCKMTYSLHWLTEAGACAGCDRDLRPSVQIREDTGEPGEKFRIETEELE